MNKKNLKIFNNNINLKPQITTLKKKIVGGQLGNIKYFPSYSKE